MLREEKVGMLELSTDTTFTSKMQEAGMEGCEDVYIKIDFENIWLKLNKNISVRQYFVL